VDGRGGKNSFLLIGVNNYQISIKYQSADIQQAKHK